MLPYKSSSLVQNVFAVHRFAQGAADWRSGPRWSILSVLCPVHPFPLRGTSPQGETRDLRRKTASHILHVPFRCFPLWWLAPPPFPRSSVGRQKESALMGRLGALLRPTWRSYAGPPQGTITRAYCRARKCTPFGGWRHHLSPGGGTLFFAMR